MFKIVTNFVSTVCKASQVGNFGRQLLIPNSRLPLLNSFPLRELGKTTRKRRKTGPRKVWTKRRENIPHDFLTAENKAFIKNVAADIYPKKSPSILKEEPWERGVWAPMSKRTGVICRKIGSYPIWKKDGTRVITTLLQVADNHAIKYHPPAVLEKNNPMLAKKRPGMGIMIVGAEGSNPEIFTGEYSGLFSEAGVMPKRKLCRFWVSPNAALQPGTPIYASHFRPGDYVNVFGKTIGHGFQGVVKRWGFKGGPKGVPGKGRNCTKNHRRTGHIGAGAGHKDNVWKGKKMPGHMGQERRLMPGLKVWRVNTKYNVVWVHGPAVPGHVHHYVYMNDTEVQGKVHQAENPPHFPTAYQDEWEDCPEDLFASDMHTFSDPSITFEEDAK